MSKHEYGREHEERRDESRDESAEFEQHAGDGTVKHGQGDEPTASAPESGSETEASGTEETEVSGADTPEAEASGSESEPGAKADAESGSGADSLFGEDGGPDELALRRMMRSAVQEIEPGDRALERLRYAVPARRQRKRQAVVGMAAAALFIGTAIPALVHVTNSGGGSDDRPSIAGNSEQTQGGSSQGKGPDGGEKGRGSDSGPSKSKDKKGKKGKKDGKGKGEASGGATGGPDPAGTASADSPACSADQLGNASGSAGGADAEGKVYGSFRIANISGSSCTVSAPGGVSTAATGAADPAKIVVADHVAGDAATGLPDPGQAVGSLVLQPGAAYEVKFAWVPSESCPTDSGEPPSPDPTPTEGSGGDSGSPGGTEPQMVREDGGVLDGGVTVSLTAAQGSPSAGATITNACAGTVYRTGMLSAS
ncbi:hypothetical protein [Streptomyces sp. NPDC058268]|uniref:hypothetical protein n=1 Tax=Streptomyces sp. NPDC058268 TaxID=3346413 RepID=UPI0036EE2438